MNAFIDGGEAFYALFDIESNPHESESSDYELWRDGWYDAQDAEAARVFEC